MSFEDTVEYLAKKVQSTKDGYSINDAEAREFLEQYPEYCDLIAENKKLNLDWIIREIKGEN